MYAWRTCDNHAHAPLCIWPDADDFVVLYRAPEVEATWQTEDTCTNTSSDCLTPHHWKMCMQNDHQIVMVGGGVSSTQSMPEQQCPVVCI